jgi:hypothetical protein
MGVFISVGTLVLGILSSIVGGIASLIGTLGVLGMSMQPLMIAVRGLAFLAGIGAIGIILKTAITGEAGAWDFIYGAMLGATAGSMFGPAGAVIGGIIVPVVIQFMRSRPQSARDKAFDEFQSQLGGNPSFTDALKGTDLINPFSDYWKNAGKTMKMGREEFNRQWSILVREAKGKKLDATMLTQIDPQVRTLFNKYKKQIKGLQDSSKGLGARIQAAWNKGKVDAVTKEVENYLKTVQELEDQFKRTDETAKRMAEAQVNATQQATENMERKIESATDNIMALWDRLHQRNQQAFGSMFSSGFLINIFRDLNSELRQFGIVIPTPFSALQQDMDLQMDLFQRWQTALANLRKQGAPLEFIDQIREMGPEAGLPIAEGLLQGGKKGFKKLIAQWKAGQQMLRQATQRDLDAQLKEWESHGKKAAWALINGIVSTSEDVQLRETFRKYIENTYGSILQEEFSQEVADAIAQAMAQVQAATPKGKGKGKGKGAGTSNMLASPVDPAIFTNERFKRLRNEQGRPTGSNPDTKWGNVNNYEITQNIYPAEGEDTKSTLRRARQESERFLNRR